jgi:GNAT superfamily N-acetyltransferase
MSLVIRTAVISDVGVLSRIYRNASLSNEGDRESLLAWTETLVLSDTSIREGRTRVAVDADGAIVGIATCLITGGAIELEDLFVHPARMRRGIGQALVMDAVSLAHEGSFDGIDVTANPHAQSFYEQVGFVLDDAVETEFYPAYRMHKDTRWALGTLETLQTAGQTGVIGDKIGRVTMDVRVGAFPPKEHELHG